jgi:hypothetical protein
MAGRRPASDWKLAPCTRGAGERLALERWGADRKLAREGWGAERKLSLAPSEAAVTRGCQACASRQAAGQWRSAPRACTAQHAHSSGAAGRQCFMK